MKRLPRLSIDSELGRIGDELNDLMLIASHHAVVAAIRRARDAAWDAQALADAARRPPACIRMEDPR